MTFRPHLLLTAMLLACNGDKSTATDVDETDVDTDGEDSEMPMVDVCTDYPGNVSCNGTIATLTGTFTADIHLTPDYTWVLSGQVQIGEGGTETTEPTETAVLTIDAGTTIYGTEQSFLAINRGSQIFANGTETEPVVFTSEKVALEEDAAPGDWGGLAINGRAPVNNCAAPGCTVAGEAGTGLFGGSMPTDDSGALTYVRIEFGGFDVLPDEELNGITFAGVGSGTEVHHIQVHANDDDGIEFFGGTVDVKYAVLSCVKDDSLDTDFGYVGRIQHLVAVQCDDFSETSDPSGTENDNLKSNNSATPRSAPVVSNATFLGRDLQSAPNFGLVFRRGTAFELHNSVVSGFDSGCLAVRDADSAPVIMHSVLHCAETFEQEDPNTTEEEDVFNAEGADNRTSNPGLADTTLTLGTTPDFRPGPGLATGGVQPSSTFFDDVDYIGAFEPGGDNWLDGWTAFPAN
jgi:hypothetical protein